MKIALTGKPGAGAPELFAAISGRELGGPRGPRIASVKVPDPRVDTLTEIWKPKKTTYTEAQFLDVSDEAQPGADGEALHALSTCDAICYVVSDLPGLDDSPPRPAADIDAFASDLILRDQMVVENRLQRMAKQNERGIERDLLQRLLEALEAGTSLRCVALSDEEWRRLSGYGFLSARPLLVVVNVDEARAAADLGPEIQAKVDTIGGQALVMCVAMEAEIAQLEPGDQRAFLAELGLEQSARDRFLQAAYKLLNLISFLTMGEDECRSWSVRHEAKAPEAGGRIHSDIERGFIRAEVIRFEDFVELRSEAACRKAGKMRVEGKDYAVQDGDILNFRFNV